MKKKQHLYVIKKYVVASSAKEAIRKEKTEDVDEVWINEQNVNNSIGFSTD